MFELPSNDVGPLVQSHGKISVRPDPVCISRVHDSFTGWSDGDGLMEICFSRFCDPGYFGCEAFHVGLLLLEGFFADKHGEVAILSFILFEFSI